MLVHSLRLSVRCCASIPPAISRAWSSSASTSAASASLEFGSAEAYRAHLEQHHAQLPAGFRVGRTSFDFIPNEAPDLPASMTLTLIAPDEPTPHFGAVFTRNAFPGAPVRVGRRRLELPAGHKIGAVIVNNKISNVGPRGGGVDDCEAVCSAVAAALDLPSSDAVLPSSTGVIGWRLPVQPLLQAVPRAVADAESGERDALCAAEGIMTTDLYPKLSSRTLSSGARVVGIAKGAGMIEPNMATMLSFILTDAALPGDVGSARAALQEMLNDAVQASFNCISVDSDQSTSDTVAVLSSAQIATPAAELASAMQEVCADLAEAVVRNGEGCNHLIRVHVRGAPDHDTARAVGKAVVNSPLFKCAVAGNDPNVGRLASAIGDCLGNRGQASLLGHGATIHMGGRCLMRDGAFDLDGEAESELSAYLRNAEQVGADGEFPAFRPHGRAVDIEVALDGGAAGEGASATVLGSDLTHEYVSINADYRS